MRILLGVTGSVATVLCPKLVEALGEAGHEVEVIATRNSLYFFNMRSLGIRVWRDEDEWPNERYVKNEEIGHIRLRDWADVLLVAPLTANTLAKMANGLSDNLLTSVFRAWDPKKPVVIAPAMNTKMWESPFTSRHLRALEELQEFGLRIHVAKPVSKHLACGDTGMGAMAEVKTIVELIEKLN